MFLEPQQTLKQRLAHLNWGLLFLVSLIGLTGFAALYSAGGGNLEPWALQHISRFFLLACVTCVIALIDIKFWFSLCYPVYFIALLMLVAVDVIGHIGMGAQRWLDLGVIKIQPSEIMKIATIMALARYFHFSTERDVRHILFLVPPVLIILAPVALVMFQPDLGTALKLLMAGGAIFFLVGVPLWMFGAVFGAGLAALPFAWSLMHEYQRKRVLTFLDPDSDPLGSGFHITQSKIALGSGGLQGKGYLDGSQSRLNFLPEKETDFIFTLWAEEWGLFGGVGLLLLYCFVIIYGAYMARQCRHVFGRLLCLGLSVNLGLYAFINTAMVSGLIPVVGVPLVLMSHGGTAMMAVMGGVGLMLSAALYKDSKLVGRL